MKFSKVLVALIAGAGEAVAAWREERATGAGAELRQALGTAVFYGMIGVTFFGLIFTPVFYVVTRRLGDLAWRSTHRTPRAPAE